MTNSLRRARRTLAFLLFVCACANAPALAQEVQRHAYKIDEVTRARCDLGEVAQVTDTGRPVFVALKEHPRARVAVVVYGRPGAAVIYAREVKGWLTEARGVLPERLLDIYGGPSPSLRLELWLVPAGAEPPPHAQPFAERRATLFDTYNYHEGAYCGPNRLPALRLFAETLKDLPGWGGTIIVRPHVNRRGARPGDGDWDESPLSRREALRRADEDRLHLVRQLGLDPTRIRVVVGAPGSWGHTELWLTPLGPRARTGGR